MTSDTRSADRTTSATSGIFPFEVSRRGVLGGGLATAVALLLSSCAAPSNSGGGGTKTTALTVGIPSDVVPKNLLGQSAVNLPVWALVFDTLVVPDGTYSDPKPSVATHWSWNDTKTQLTMTLRDDVVFHDGRKFGPDDVAFAVKAMAAAAATDNVGVIAEKISSVRTTGANEVTFVLDSPVGNFFDLLGLMPLVNSTTLKGLAAAEHVVGTGPFVWGIWAPGSQLTLTKNKKYWRPGLPVADKVTLRVFTQSQALVAAMRSGQIDVAFNLVPRDAATLAKSGTGIRALTSKPGFATYYVAANVTSKPLTDVRVRQAIAWSIDRDRIAQQVFFGYGTATAVPWLQSLPGVTKQDSTYYGYDPSKARQLLREAGASGVTLGLTYNIGNPTHVAVFNIVQNNLQSIGLTVVPHELQAAEYSSQTASASIEGLWIGSAQTSASLATVVEGLRTFSAAKNASRFSTPEYTKLSSMVAAAATPADVAAANSALTQYVLEQAFNITVSHGYFVTAVGPKVDGVSALLSSNLVLTSAKVS